MCCNTHTMTNAITKHKIKIYFVDDDVDDDDDDPGLVSRIVMTLSISPKILASSADMNVSRSNADSASRQHVERTQTNHHMMPTHENDTK